MAAQEPGSVVQVFRALASGSDTRQLVVELLQAGAQTRLRLIGDLLDDGQVGRRHITLGVVIHHDVGLEGVGQPQQPFVGVGPFVRAHRRHQPGGRVRVAQMQADGGGFIEHQVACARRGFNQGGNLAVGVELEVIGAFVLVLAAVHQDQLKRRAQLFEHDVRDHAGIAGMVVELNHGGSFRPNSEPEQLALQAMLGSPEIAILIVASYAFQMRLSAIFDAFFEIDITHPASV